MLSHQDMESLYAHFDSIDGYDAPRRSAAPSPLSHYSFLGNWFAAARQMVSAAAPAEIPAIAVPLTPADRVDLFEPKDG
ncbi:hypothetical protein DL767_008536 [Monosporascus sp. MG133]|nr:hypothetical protein DL767_008536 [Monosporascus sp. MG133]